MLIKIGLLALNMSVNFNSFSLFNDDREGEEGEERGDKEGEEDKEGGDKEASMADINTKMYTNQRE